MDEANEQRAQKLLASRLEAMGIEMTPLPGGRCAEGELRLRSASFPGLSGDLQFSRLRFATVGGGHLKCLSPEAFFQLPLIAIGSCSDSRQVEDRIRASWSRHIQALRETAKELRRLGVTTHEEIGGSALAFSLDLEAEDALARCLDARHLVFPGSGPLSGLPLRSPKQRIARLDLTAESAADLEIGLTSQIEAIVRGAERAEAERRLLAASPSRENAQAKAPIPIETAQPRAPVRVLLVGGILGRDQSLRQALHGLGLRTRIEYSSADALAAFREQSFDLVLTDAHLGRSEGIELIAEIGSLPGIDRLPIVLVDEHARSTLKQAARSLGAAGYLVHPIGSDKVLSGLGRMASGQRGRRFSRLDHRLHVAWQADHHGFTRSIGRGGLFVRSESGVVVPEYETLEIALPEFGEQILIETRAVFRVDAAGTPDPGVGLRFHGFPNRDEARWIAYLTAMMHPDTRR